MPPDDEEHEILDVVDDNDQPITTLSRADAYQPSNLQGHYLRAASCFLMNRQGKIYVPRRTADKKIAPNGLDYSAGGHVQAGETYLQAIKREIAEELGLQPSADQLTEVTKLPPNQDRDYYFGMIYLYRTDETPQLNTDDFSSYEWLSLDETLQRLYRGEKAKSSLIPALEHLQKYLAQ